jgi:hypothetical protein
MNRSQPQRRGAWAGVFRPLAEAAGSAERTGTDPPVRVPRTAALGAAGDSPTVSATALPGSRWSLRAEASRAPRVCPVPTVSRPPVPTELRACSGVAKPAHRASQAQWGQAEAEAEAAPWHAQRLQLQPREAVAVAEAVGAVLEPAAVVDAPAVRVSRFTSPDPGAFQFGNPLSSQAPADAVVTAVQVAWEEPAVRAARADVEASTRPTQAADPTTMVARVVWVVPVGAAVTAAAERAACLTRCIAASRHARSRSKAAPCYHRLVGGEDRRRRALLAQSVHPDRQIPTR